MRWAKAGLLVVAISVVTMSMLIWRAQVETNRNLEALTAALAARPAETTPAPAQVPAPTPVPTPVPVPPSEPSPFVVPTSGSVPRELDRVSLQPVKNVPREPQRVPVSPPPYVIDVPDSLLIEAVIKDPRMNTNERLPVQPIAGSFQVRLDGTVGLGIWGSVPVSGLSLGQATEAIHKAITATDTFKGSRILPENLIVVVDVLAYNSKRYYVIFDGKEGGEQVMAFPISGTETVSVFDAMTKMGDFAKDVGKRSIWISRRGPTGTEWQTFAVDWVAITQGIVTTNYQLLPGDRLYIKAAK